MQVKLSPSKISGKVKIPTSKSHTIRALLIAAMAEGKSTIYNALDSADTKACINACRDFGAEILIDKNKIEVTGINGKINYSKNIIDVLNSGTTLYLAAGLAALGNEEIRFTGDDQIKSRPADKLLNSLKDLGVDIKSNNNKAPFSIKGPVKGGKTSIECPTSQYLSSLLLALPLAKFDSIIEVPLLEEKPYVEMTLKYLDEQGIKYRNTDFEKFEIQGNQKYKAINKTIPADFSSATFFMCAAAITGSRIELQDLDVNDSQGDKAVLDYLKTMGCSIETLDNSVVVQGNTLKGAVIDLNATPDALPAMAVTACFAEGETRLVNVAHARLKETDRIKVMAEELKKMGADIQEQNDGLIIRKSNLKGLKVHGHHDHRVVMSLAIASLVAEGKTEIDTAEAVNITFPGFFELLDSVRIK